MALVVETGQIIPGADSYVGLVDARALAEKYGKELPADDTAAEAALRNGAVYVGLQERVMCGSRVSAEQELAYPRQHVFVYGFPVAADSIPSQLIKAQVLAALSGQRPAAAPQAPGGPPSNLHMHPTARPVEREASV
jgi:hypothetical protein